MTRDAKERSDHENAMAIDAAFRAGDLTALRAALRDPDVVPNGPMPRGIGACLEYAIYHSPLAFIRELLELGADPNPAEHDGYPPLIAALSCGRSLEGVPARNDVMDIVALLLAFGADPNQRGVNDFTALHFAVQERNLAAIEQLLAAGADPRSRTRIDDRETPREMAEAAGFHELARTLAEGEEEVGK
jgi:ankyrin repeat protein